MVQVFTRNNYLFMENILERVKNRLAQPGSPIRTVKGVADAIDMSESGFYRMLERHTYKKSTLLAMAHALGVKESYLMGEADLSTVETDNSSHDSLEGILSELKILREQLQVKDRQLEAKDNQIGQLLDLLGKLEGANLDQLLKVTGDKEEDLMGAYRVATFVNNVIPSLRDIFLPQAVTK